MSLLDQIRSRKADLEAIARKYGASNVRIFGSVARGEDRATSDIDLLVDMDADCSLLDLVGFQQAVSAALGRPADVLTERAISPYLIERVVREAVRL
jgi:predicted nucleotidyltransferase